MSIDEWIKKLWSIYAMEYYSDLERNECELVELRWMSIKPAIQSEVGLKKKTNIVY